MDGRGNRQPKSCNQDSLNSQWMVVTPIEVIFTLFYLAQDNKGGDPDLLPTREIKPKHQIKSSIVEVCKVYGEP